MRINPERPERIVEVKNNKFGKWEIIRKGSGARRWWRKNCRGGSRGRGAGESRGRGRFRERKVRGFSGGGRWFFGHVLEKGEVMRDS